MEKTSDNIPDPVPTKASNITPAIKFSQEEQTYHKHLTLGIEEKLHKNRMIKEIKLTLRKPAEKPSLSSWKRKNGVSLPSDLKDYYLSTNGLKLTWSLEHAGDHLKIGEMNINQINLLLPLESIDHVDRTGDGIRNTSTRLLDPGKFGIKSKPLLDGTKSTKIPPLGGSEEASDTNKFSVYFTELRKTTEANGQAKSQDPNGLFLQPHDKAFILDQNKYGWVCLIYPEAKNKTLVNIQTSPRSVTEPVEVPEPNVEIWFLDNSLQWHYLAPTFSHYYRMLLFHLGLPQWQYRFTPYGLSSWAEQMFWLVAPHLLTPPKTAKCPSVYHDGGLWSSDIPAEAAAPNPTPNVLSSQIFRRKKKDKDKLENKA